MTRREQQQIDAAMKQIGVLKNLLEQRRHWLGEHKNTIEGDAWIRDNFVPMLALLGKLDQLIDAAPVPIAQIDPALAKQLEEWRKQHTIWQHFTGDSF